MKEFEGEKGYIVEVVENEEPTSIPAVACLLPDPQLHFSNRMLRYMTKRVRVAEDEQSSRSRYQNQIRIRSPLHVTL